MKEKQQLKILQLNAWTGRIKGALIDFIKSGNFDVVCLQEAVWCDDVTLTNFFATVDEIKEKCGYPYDVRGSNWGLRIFSADTIMEQGNVILSRKPFEYEEVKDIDDKYIIASTIEDFHYHLLTALKVKIDGLTVINYHGYWDKNPLGTEETVRVTKKLADFVKNSDSPLVFCSDFNIIYESPAMRELDFLHDLTHEYNIENTLAGLKFDGKVACDHILVSDDVTVKSFAVNDRIVSDHNALIAEIEYTKKPLN